MECRIWSRGKTLQFIECYRSHPLLWDSNHNFYKDKMKRHSALLDIASKFKVERYEVERKIKNLQSHFLRERKKEVVSRKSGAAEPYASRWFAYKSLLFLSYRNKQRTTKTKAQDFKMETEAHFKKCWNILKACERNLNIASTSRGSHEMQTEADTETAHVVKEEPTESCEDPLEQLPEETSIDALIPAPGPTRLNVEEETPLSPSSRTSMSDDAGATSPNSVPERYITKHSQNESAFIEEKYKRAQIRDEELHQLKMEEQMWLVKAAEELYKKNSLEKEAAELKLKRLQSI